MTDSEQISALERYGAVGDIPAMAKTISALHAKWDTLSESRQADVRKLEAVFLSLVNLRIDGRE